MNHCIKHKHKSISCVFFLFFGYEVDNQDLKERIKTIQKSLLVCASHVH